jgi:hypothetical protein
MQHSHVGIRKSGYKIVNWRIYEVTIVVMKLRIEIKLNHAAGDEATCCTGKSLRLSVQEFDA